MKQKIIDEIKSLIERNAILSSRGYTKHNEIDDKLTELYSKYPFEYKEAYKRAKEDFGL